VYQTIGKEISDNDGVWYVSMSINLDNQGSGDRTGNVMSYVITFNSLDKLALVSTATGDAV